MNWSNFLYIPSMIFEGRGKADQKCPVDLVAGERRTHTKINEKEGNWKKKKIQLLVSWTLQIPQFFKYYAFRGRNSRWTKKRERKK